MTAGVCLLVSKTLASGFRENIETVSILNGNGKFLGEGSDITLWMANRKEKFSKRKIEISDSDCSTASIINDDSYFSAECDSGTKISIQMDSGPKHNIFRTAITAPSANGSMTMCMSTAGANWYGGAENHNQPWPIQNQSLAQTAFVTMNPNGGVLDRYFLSSTGESYFFNESQPLFVSIDATAQQICFINEYATPYRNTDGRELEMIFYYSKGDNLLDGYKMGLDNYFERPAATPSEKVFRDPIWSTWAAYKKNINQTTVLQFSQDIDDNGFPVSQIEIDDSWETCYGNEKFDPVRFPDPAGMVATLKERGHDVTLWVHPFINTDCARFTEGDENLYFVTSDGYDETGITSWWDGSQSGIIDITKSTAAEWWYQRLDALRTDIGITAFKFDAGEVDYLPANAYLNSTEELQPGVFSTEYARFANRFGGQVEVQVGYRSNDVSIFVRMLDRDSVWGLDNGLQSVITSALHMGLVGSPFVLPDYIGGNAYGTDYPDRELFIRWVELTAFLPVMQFSITPWSYDDEVVQICKDMVAVHQKIGDVIVTAAQQATVDGYPIIRPLWWVDPTDDFCQTINDQFMVGDTYMVAPIVTPGATSRDIYFPTGIWIDQMNGGYISGPTTLIGYSVPLDQIAYFSVE